MACPTGWGGGGRLNMGHSDWAEADASGGKSIHPRESKGDESLLNSREQQAGQQQRLSMMRQQLSAE